MEMGFNVLRQEAPCTFFYKKSFTDFLSSVPSMKEMPYEMLVSN